MLGIESEGVGRKALIKAKINKIYGCAEKMLFLFFN